MITTDYIHKFIDHTINKYIPEGIDPLFHINIRKEIKLLLLQLFIPTIRVRIVIINIIVIGIHHIVFCGCCSCCGCCCFFLKCCLPFFK